MIDPMRDEAAAYVRSRSGAWHVIASEAGERVITDCGLALQGALIDTMPPRRPRVRPCLICRWPNGYPKWETP